MCYGVEQLEVRAPVSEQLELFLESAPPGPPEGALQQPVEVQTAPEKIPVAIRTEALRFALARGVPKPITLHITRNRQTMASVRPQPDGHLAVRLNAAFLDAPEQVWTATAAWVKNPRDRAAGAVVDAFIRENAPRREAPEPRAVPLHTRGRVHDLRPMYDELNAQHFGGSITASLTWGNAPHSHRRRYMRLGSYMPVDNIIRIHPHLDEENVPAFFVRYIVFHEMLHAHLGIGTTDTGRRRVHPPAFRAAERTYPDFARAEAWLKEPRNLARIMRARKS
jgi:hypothetical protein